MSRSLLVLLLCLLSGSLQADLPAVTDTEAALARENRIEKEFRKLRQRHLSDEDYVAAFEQFIATHPGHLATADAYTYLARFHFDRTQVDAQLEASRAFFDSFGTSIPHAGTVQQLLARTVQNRNLGDAQRLEAFRLLSSNCRYASWVLSLTRNALAGMDVSPRQRYDLAWEASGNCGAFPYTRAFVWHFLEPWARATGDGVPARAALNAFVARYPEPSPEPHAARRLLLEWDAARGETGAQTTLSDYDAAFAAQVAALDVTFPVVEALLAAGDYDAANDRLAQEPVTPWWEAARRWQGLFDRFAKNMPPAARLRFARLILERLPLCRLVEMAVRDAAEALHAGGRREGAAFAEAAAIYMQRHLHDISRDVHRLHDFVRTMHKAGDLDQLLGTLDMTSEGAGQMELPALQADFLLHKAKAALMPDRPAAVAALARLVALDAPTPATTKGRWLQEQLTGERSLVCGPHPRPAPLQPLSAPTGSDVVVLDATFYDNDVTTGWFPMTLPARLTLVRTNAIPLSGVRVQWSVPCRYRVLLQDASRRVLARFDRVWPYVDGLCQYWPPQDETIQFSPALNPAHVQVELLSVQERGRAGLAELELRTAAKDAGRAYVLQPRHANVQGYPTSRWQSPWVTTDHPLMVSRAGGNLAVLWHGGSPTLHLSGEGAVCWTMSGGARGRIVTSSHEEELFTLPAAPPGRRILTLQAEPAPAANDQFARNEIRFVRLAAKSTVAGQTNTISMGSGPAAVLSEDLDTVVAALQARKASVVYARTGTAAERAAAQQLADRAGVYLVSDDVALNQYPGPWLAVGTPWTHRLNRDLVAAAHLWNDQKFLNRREGIVAARHVGGSAPLYAVTAADADGVVQAAARLAAHLTPREPATTVRCFTASSLEWIYPWMLHPERPEAKELVLVLGRNDRRSLQVGLAFDRDVEVLEAGCDELIGPDDSRLRAPEVRFAAFYEWAPFFGTLRLPDPLVPEPPLPLPANTAMGLWLTVRVPDDAAPGRYRGELDVRADGQLQRLPVTVEVRPVTVPAAAGVVFGDFATVPYWYDIGRESYWPAYEALVENAAAHGINMLWVRSGAPWKEDEDGETRLIAPNLLQRQLDVAESVYRRQALPPPLYQCSGVELPRGVERDEGVRLLRLLAADLRRQGLWDRVYVKVGDEPGNAAAWIDSARLYEDGGLQVTTAHGPNLFSPEAAAVMDAWCPNYLHDLTHPFLEERREAGDPVWWYCCGEPSTRLTGRPVDSLAFYWLTAKWGLDGGLSYSALHAKERGSEGNDMPFRYDHGLSFRMMFLPNGRLIDTTRREWEAEGIQDCKLIRLIQQRLDAREAAGHVPAAQSMREELNRILATVVPYRYRYPAEAEAWLEGRRQLYELAVRVVAAREE